MQIHACTHSSLHGRTKGTFHAALSRHHLRLTNFVLIQVLALVNILILLFIQFFVHPYKNKMANYLESFALLVLIMLLGLGNTPAFVETVDVVLWPLFYLPIFVEIVIITVYVGYILW